MWRQEYKIHSSWRGGRGREGGRERGREGGREGGREWTDKNVIDSLVEGSPWQHGILNSCNLLALVSHSTILTSR